LKRGKLYEKAGNYEKALADYTQAQQLDPSDSSTYLGQGSVLSAMDQPDDAIEKYLIVREIDLQNDRSTRLIDYLIEKEREER
ncbi:MAG: tetratricopeptide repeat protein, partial [Cyanobacteria bacterium P01_F01_bin.3]